MMCQKASAILVLMLVLTLGLLARAASGQSPQPYPNATTDQNIHPKTAMAPSAVNVPFHDPDFGTQMVRVTDGNSVPHAPEVTFQASSAGKDAWSRDGRKFLVNASGGGVYAFGFDPSTMTVQPLFGSKPGQGFLLPLLSNPTFSRVDADLVYGTIGKTRLTISAYRFSMKATSPVIDTTTCGTIPALVPGPGVNSDNDVNVSDGDTRFSISEGANEFGRHMFAVVYDKKLGCRWYNTETGEIGGQWGSAGVASTSDRYDIQHAYLSRSGRYLRIEQNAGFYVWDLGTLKVIPCPLKSSPPCDGGYSVNGYNSMVGRGALIGDWNVVKRPLKTPTQTTPLVWPLTAGIWGQEKHFTWNNDTQQDTKPVCGSAFTYYTEDAIERAYDGEIFCLETDGLRSTIWRFAHHRSNADRDLFNTTPTVSISRDGRFLLFNSNWDEQLGFLKNGDPRADIWIVKLD